ncbi:MAG: hypothetical protein K8R89_03170 [Anaerolineae bacterium]|nr:hypothetical protein [Anaerolineae bacterium]
MSVLWQQRTHGVQRQKEQQTRAAARFFLLIFVALLVLAGAYATLAAANVKLGEEVWDQEKELVSGERENQFLIIEIARLSSIPELQRRATELGYVPADAVDYIWVTEQ